MATEQPPTPNEVAAELRRIAKRKKDRKTKDREDTLTRNGLFQIGRHQLNMTTSELAREANVTTQTVRDVLHRSSDEPPDTEEPERS